MALANLLSVWQIFKKYEYIPTLCFIFDKPISSYIKYKKYKIIITKEEINVYKYYTQLLTVEQKELVTGILNPNLNLIALKELFQKVSNNEMLLSLIEHENLNSDVIEMILNHDLCDHDVLFFLVKNAQPNTDILQKILIHPKITCNVLYSMLRHANLSTEVLQEIIKHQKFDGSELLLYLFDKDRNIINIPSNLLQEILDQNTLMLQQDQNLATERKVFIMWKILKHAKSRLNKLTEDNQEEKLILEKIIENIFKLCEKLNDQHPALRLKQWVLQCSDAPADLVTKVLGGSSIKELNKYGFSSDFKGLIEMHKQKHIELGDALLAMSVYDHKKDSDYLSRIAVPKEIKCRILTFLFGDNKLTSTKKDEMLRNYSGCEVLFRDKFPLETVYEMVERGNRARAIM